MKHFFVLCIFAFSFVPAFEAANPFQHDPFQHDPIKSLFKPESCPKPTRLPQPFDLTKYLGDWYEIKATKPLGSWMFESDLRCVKTNYYVDAYPNIVINRSGLYLANNTLSGSRSGVAEPTQQDNVLQVEFSKPSPYNQYWVVDTDYYNYALVVSCNRLYPFFTLRGAWILSRKPTLDDDTVKNLIAKLDPIGIKDIHLFDTVQNC